MVDHFRLHVWLHPFVNWHPEHSDFDSWRPTGDGDLPEEVRGWPEAERYYRETLQWTPDSGFLMPESDHPIALHPLTVWSRSFVGGVPIPWKLEAPQAPTAIRHPTLAMQERHPDERDVLRSAEQRSHKRVKPTVLWR